MAHPATLWATDGGAGLKDGTSLANAAAIDPGDANDIVTIINADDPAADGTTVRLCADGDVITTATFAINRDGLFTRKFYLVSRNAADTANAYVALDANGGAFAVITLTAADYWQFERIGATNTDGLAGNHAWSGTADADGCIFIDCKGTHAYRGFDIHINSMYCELFRCEASENADYGVIGFSNGTLIDCQAHNNGNHGFEDTGNLVRCVASGNLIGFNKPRYLADHCIAYGNSSHGFSNNYLQAMFIGCAATENGAYGYDMNSYWNHLINCAHYSNVSGGISGTDYTSENVIALTADPFVNAAAGDFRLNNAAGGGADLRAIAYEVSGQTGYADIGALQSRPSILVPNRRGNLQ